MMSKNINLAATFLLLFSLFFFCKGASFGVISQHVGMDTGGMMGDQSHVMPCCDMDSAAAAAHEIGDFSLPGGQELLVVFALVAAFLFVDSLKSFFKIHSTAYIRHVRDRFGSWRFFHLFNRLFRLGILNPKTF